MQVKRHNIQFINSKATHQVAYFKCESSPDVIVTDLIRRLSKQSAVNFKKLIVVCDFSFTHKRLESTEEIQILFLLNKNKANITFQKICIQPLNSTLTLKYQTLKRVFSLKERFVVDFKFSSHLSENEMSSALELKPIYIPKPWGQEIWYSGIESRGISKIQIKKNSVPLSWFLAAFPYLVFGKKLATKDPILLKILDPHKEPVKGDLYYELHREKNEVYIVTSMSRSKGRIKIGIDQNKFSQYQSRPETFKAEFLSAILDYEKVRREIDLCIDSNHEISSRLILQEESLRKNMDSFCGFLDLNIGDVVSVPTQTPHALQHGVQVVEFQTPTYERLIISFAQKVLTQPHWDTEKAFENINLTPFQHSKLNILSKTSKILKELVCEFSDFKVVRWTIKANTKVQISLKPFYRIILFITGKSIWDKKLIKKQTCLLIAQKQKVDLQCQKDTVFLLCEPLIPASKLCKEKIL